jgi:hypothetical protein
MTLVLFQRVVTSYLVALINGVAKKDPQGWFASMFTLWAGPN